MDPREQQRKIRHRVAVLRHGEEVTGNVAATCRYYSISQPTFYKWLHRYEELGEAGLGDRSSRPLFGPHEAGAEVAGKIVYVRQHLPLWAAEGLDVPAQLSRSANRARGGSSNAST